MCALYSFSLLSMEFSLLHNLRKVAGFLYGYAISNVYIPQTLGV